MSQSPLTLSSERTLSSALLFAGIILVGANLRAAITVVGPVLTDIRHSTGLSDSAAGWLNALPLLIFALLAPAAPRMAAKWGMERVIGLALSALVAGIVWRSAGGRVALWGGTCVLGAAIALCNVILPALAKRSFPTKAARVIGGYAAMMGVVAAFASGAAVMLTHGDTEGWQRALDVWALPALLALLVWLPQLRTRTLPAHTRLAALDPHPEQYRSPWKSSTGWQVALFMGLHSTVFYVLVDWFPAYAQTVGISAAMAGRCLFVYQCIAVLANLSMTVIIPRVKDQRGLGLLCSGLILAGVSGLYYYPAQAMFWLVLAGTGAGIAMVVCLSLFNLRSHGHSQAAALSGMAQCVGYLMAAAGPALVGIAVQHTHQWAVPFTLLMGLAAVQTVISVLAGRDRTIG